MYATRPLSLYRKSPEAIHEPPPQGPNSGYLVVVDDETEAEAACCLGLCTDNRVKKLPFPQNKMLQVQYTHSDGQSTTVESDKVFFIPVLDQPLSSNRYYVILADGKRRGYASTCSREEDMATCCFCNCIKDVKPRPFDHMDIYQQVEITPRRFSGFVAKSISPDGFPAQFLRRKDWNLSWSTSHDYQLGEAHGLDESLRAHLPELDFPVGNKRSAAVSVGKWYCPFIFIKEMTSLKEQIKKSPFYEMSLQRFWEEIHTCEKYGNEGNVVAINANVQKKSVALFGRETEPVCEDTPVENGIMWFRPLNNGGEETGVGLNMAIVERMRWEAVRGGWDDKTEKNVRVNECGKEGWKKFGCYILVERFALRRMDGSLVLCFDFRHTHRIQSKWE